MKSLLYAFFLLLIVSSALALEDGPVREWRKDHDGRDYVAVIGQVENGKKSGEWREYDRNGNCTLQTVYDSDGKVVTQERDVTSGKVVYDKTAQEYQRMKEGQGYRFESDGTMHKINDPSRFAPPSSFKAR